MSVSVKTAKKIGLFSAISILIGSVIGIGIFFKNNTVFQNNDNNAIGVLISWILASVISLATAYSFSELGLNHRNGSGIGGVVEKHLGHKFGRFISFNNSFFYFGILNLAVAIFSAESIVNIFMENQSITIHFAAIMTIGLALIFIFVVFNYLSLKWSTIFQVVSTILKFLPLSMVAIAGLVYGIIHPNLSLFDPSSNHGSLSINGILSSIPAILFAYDSFLGVASLQGEMENPRKKVPLTIVVGMGICIVMYLFITIGQIMVSSGTAGGVFEIIFANNPVAKHAFSIFINIFILICVLGVLNSLVLVSLRTNLYAVKHRIYYGYWWFNKMNTSDLKIGMIVALFIYTFWWIILMIPSAILDTDAFVDGISNFPTLFMFAIYGTVVLKGFINRFDKRVHVIKMPGFMFIAPIAIIGCYLAFGYQFFYFFSINAFLHPFEKINWGLFKAGTYTIKAYMGSICFLTMLLAFSVLPLINDSLIKLRYKKMNLPKNNLLVKELII